MNLQNTENWKRIQTQSQLLILKIVNLMNSKIFKKYKERCHCALDYLFIYLLLII